MWSAYSVEVILGVLTTGLAVGASGVTGVVIAGRSWLFESCDDDVVTEVLTSLPVIELSPRNAVRTKMKVRAIFEDLPAISAAFLYVVDRRSNAVRPRVSSIISSDRTLRREALARETV
jgi:hypothetical protein